MSEFDRRTLPTVSVVIPTKNRKRFLEVAVASVVAATERAREVRTVQLVVVDDGSTDAVWISPPHAFLRVPEF